MLYYSCWSNSAAPPLQILSLENRVLELELRSEKVTGERDALRDRLRTLETSRKELADEYIILKSNYLALGKELDQEVRQPWCFPLHPTTSQSKVAFGLLTKPGAALCPRCPVTALLLAESSLFPLPYIPIPSHAKRRSGLGARFRSLWTASTLCFPFFSAWLAQAAQERICSLSHLTWWQEGA